MGPASIPTARLTPSGRRSSPSSTPAVDGSRSTSRRPSRSARTRRRARGSRTSTGRSPPIWARCTCRSRSPAGVPTPRDRHDPRRRLRESRRRPDRRSGQLAPGRRDAGRSGHRRVVRWRGREAPTKDRRSSSGPPGTRLRPADAGPTAWAWPSAGSFADLAWAVAARKLRRLGEAARLASAPPRGASSRRSTPGRSMRAAPPSAATSRPARPPGAGRLTARSLPSRL